VKETRIIIVVSSEQATRESIRVLLKDRVLIREARSLPAAQEKILSHRPSLLIVDSALLQGHSQLGLQSLERLAPGVPIMLLTIMDEEMVDRLVDGEQVTLLRKPFEPKEFVEKCEHLLEISRLRAQNRMLQGPGEVVESGRRRMSTMTQLRQQRSSEAVAVNTLFPQPLTPFSVTQGLYLILPRLNLFLQALSNVLDVEKLVHRAVEGFTELFGLSFCSLLVLDEDTLQYPVAASHGLDAAMQSELRLTMDSPLIQWLLRNNQCLSKDLCFERAAIDSGGYALHQEMEILHAEWVLPLWNQGRLLGLVGVSKRATGRDLTEEELDLLRVLASYVTVALQNALSHHRISAEKTYNKNILNDLGSGVLAMDAAGRIISLNHNGEKILALSAGDVEGRKIGLAGSVVADILLRTLEENQCFSRHEFIYPANQKLIGASTSVMSDERGRQLGAVMVFADLSEVPSVPSQMQQERTFEELINLTAWLAHEIKNPLVAIKTFTQLLPQKYDDGEFRDSFQSVVEAEVSRLDGVVENVLEFGKREQLERRPADIHMILDHLVKEMRAELKKRSIKLNKKYEVKDKLVAIDERQIHIALKSLFRGALEDASTGHLLLRTSLTYADEAKGNGKRQDYLKIHLRGSEQQGALRELQNIFLPYTGTSENQSHLALGLAQKIIRQHQGWLEVANERAPGADFAIVLPTVQN